MANLKLKDLLHRARSTSVYWTERAVLDYTSALWAAMQRKGVSQVELANRIGKKPPYISRVLNGTPNVTIKTMVELANALDLRVHVALAEKQETGAALYMSIMANVDERPGSQGLTRRVTSRVNLAAANDSFAVVAATAA